MEAVPLAAVAGAAAEPPSCRWASANPGARTSGGPSSAVAGRSRSGPVHASSSVPGPGWKSEPEPSGSPGTAATSSPRTVAVSGSEARRSADPVAAVAEVVPRSPPAPSSGAAKKSSSVSPVSRAPVSARMSTEPEASTR